MNKLIGFLLLVAFISCNSKKSDSSNSSNSEQAQPSTTEDSIEIRNTIMSFYNWYSDSNNYRKFMRYNLYDGINQPDAPPYKINWPEVDRYLRFISDSVPQLGDAFVAQHRKFFEQCDSAFKKDLEDEIPYGFDYDWFTNSQEDAKYTVEMLSRESWKIIVNEDTADAKVGVLKDDWNSGLLIKMKKENGKWTIANIGGV